MNTFDSKNAYWDFERTVQNERRWVFDGKAADFLAATRTASKSRAGRLKAGLPLWRAQVGSRPGPTNQAGIEEEYPFSKERMVPERRHTKSGRANPPGFAYLYLASTPETALAEMRPWFGESLTLAIFKTEKEINLVVCQAGTEGPIERLFDENPPADKLDQYVWNDISRAFARPVNRDDQESAYMPTQILAEAFKAEGFDGIAYRSGLERGTNVVLFDISIARPAHCYLYTLKKVRYEFEAYNNHAVYIEKNGIGQCRTEIHTESP